jgi:protein-tyrosine phosphatase
MISSILTVCTGNICRSPVAEAALKLNFPNLDISSAGLHALVGHDVDSDSRAAAKELGLEFGVHAARQLDDQIGKLSDLILVLDRGHMREIHTRYPNLTGKCFLLGHYSKIKEVPDPYRLGLANHFRAVELILEATKDWTVQIERLL